MSRTVKFIILALCLTASSAALVSAQKEQAFSISGNLKFSNGWQSLAVNTKTDDVLVTWLHIKSADDKQGLFCAVQTPQERKIQGR